MRETHDMTVSGPSRSAINEATSARFRAFFTGRNPDDRKRRGARLHRWSWAFRATRNKARLERYGLDVSGSEAMVAQERRRLRNARKRERHG